MREARWRSSCQWVARGVPVVALTMVLVACGGGNGRKVDVSSDGDEVLAEAVRIDAAVAARTGDAAGFSEVGDPVPVGVGDMVRTDATGFAEIAYVDGSVARLDVDTELELVALEQDDATTQIRARMGLGRTWHRVRELANGSSYVVETSVGTATVRGTVFVVRCLPTECVFTVLEGRLQVEVEGGDVLEVTAGEKVVVSEEGDSGGVQPIAGDPIDDDAWLARNNDLDTADGYPDLGDAEKPTSTGILAPGPDGTVVVWEFDMVLTAWENGGERRFGPDIGTSPDPAADDYRPSTVTVICVEDRCVAEGSFVHIEYGTTRVLAPKPDGRLGIMEGQRQSEAGCGATQTLEADITVDPVTGALEGELTRVTEPLEIDNCLLSSATFAFAADAPARSTCADPDRPPGCLGLLAGEDVPTGFERPEAWG